MDRTPKFKIHSRRKKKNAKKSHSSGTPGRAGGGETPVKASVVDLHPSSQFMDSEPVISWGSPQVSPSYEISSRRDWRAASASTPLRGVSASRAVGTPSQFLRGLMDFSEQLKVDIVGSSTGVESGGSCSPLAVEVSGPDDDAEESPPPPSPRYRPCPEELERLKGDSLRALLDDADDDVILECSQEVEDVMRRQEGERVASVTPRSSSSGKARRSPEKTPTPRRKGLRTAANGSSVKKDPWGDSFDDAVRRMLEDDFPTTTPKASPGLKGETFQQIVRRMLDECRPVEPPTQPLLSDPEDQVRPEVDGEGVWARLLEGDEEDMARCSQEAEDVVRCVGKAGRSPRTRPAAAVAGDSPRGETFQQIVRRMLDGCRPAEPPTQDPEEQVLPEADGKSVWARLLEGDDEDMVRCSQQVEEVVRRVGKAGRSPRTRPAGDSPRGETFQEIVRRMLDGCRPAEDERVVRRSPRRGGGGATSSKEAKRKSEDARKDPRRKSPRLRAAAQTSHLQYFRPEEEDDLAKVLDIVESQTVHGSPLSRCTPEEILQKKLEAKRRLAKKKKLSLRPKR